jgi:hypothetical protein
MSGFVVDPAAAHAAARACRSQADFLVEMICDANMYMYYPDEFGDCRIGQALGDKFTGKRGGDRTGLVTPLLKAWHQLVLMAGSFEAMAEGYRSADHGGAGSIGTAGEAW